MSAIAPTLQGFFTERLVKQRQVSPRTIASYRDSLKLLFVFVQQRTGKTPATLDWADLDVEVIGAFLEHLETDRHNGPRTRNLRLTAIRSLFAYAALRHPEHAELIQRVLAIPAKRFDKQLVSFLTPVEIDALIDAPDRSRWEGRRDRAEPLGEDLELVDAGDLRQFQLVDTGHRYERQVPGRARLAAHFRPQLFRE